MRKAINLTKLSVFLCVFASLREKKISRKDAKTQRKSCVFAAILILFAAFGAAAQKIPSKPRNSIWVSSTASADVIANRQSIAAFADKAKQTGFDTVILYTKELNGHVIYPSKIAPRLAAYRNVRYDTAFDPLKTFIEECHRRGMRLHAAFDIFTEGNKVFPGVGIGFNERKDWQSIVYDVDEADKKIKRAPIGEFKQGIPLWVNAALPAVQNYEISIISEVLKNYAVDGIVMDRARWNGVNADFSDFSGELFKKYVEDENLRFPADVYEIKLDQNGKKQIVEGKYLKKWHEWRATVIRSFVEKLRAAVKKQKPKVSFESYVGSWFPIYGNDVGVNWASANYKVPYDWASADFGKTGYARLVDVLYVGLYYRHNTEAEAVKAGAKNWQSIEGAARLAKEVTNGDTTIRGVINYGDDNLSAEKLKSGTQIILELTGGVSIFEASHIKRRDLWALPEEILKLQNSPR